MFYLKNIQFKNFCGYKDFELCFCKNDSHLPLCVFFGSNGTGKSTVLSGIRMLANPYQFFGRNNDLYFRKMTWHKDYDPTYSGFMLSQTDMLITGTFIDINKKEYIVKIDKNGIVESELPRYNSDQEGWAVFTDADHPMNMNKFQLKEEAASKFIEIASYIYGLPIHLDKKVTTQDMGDSASFFQDLIVKKNEVKVHFKRMSDGERKIATLLRHICNENVTNPSHIYLIDNAEMHIYFKRHSGLVKRLMTCFPEKQFITTSHSSTFIGAVEKYIGTDGLIDLEKVHGFDFVSYDT